MRFSAWLCLVVVVLGLLTRPSVAWWGGNDEEHHEHHHTDNAPEPESDDPDIVNVVTCGSVIKLKHEATGYRLHSHQVSYGSGSGQQSVTSVPNSDDNNSLWVVRGAHGKKRCKQGVPIKNGDVIRLQHLSTKTNLHSHYHASPLSKQQEVSCFGPDGNGDTSDNWRVVASTPQWERGKVIELQHADTDQYLHSHNMKFKHPIPGQQEVTCFPHSNANTKWFTAEGIYFPPRAAAKNVEKIEEDKVEVEGEAREEVGEEPSLEID